MGITYQLREKKKIEKEAVGKIQRALDNSKNYGKRSEINLKRMAMGRYVILNKLIREGAGHRNRKSQRQNV